MSIFVYFCWIVLVVYGLVLLNRKYMFNSYPNRFEKHENNVFGVVCLVIFFITAFRAEYFGGPDTINYVYYFENDKGSYYFYNDTIKDYGYIGLMYFLRFFVSGRPMFIFVMSVIILLPIYLCINKYSTDKVLSVVLFVCFPMSTWLISMAAFRQSISISCILFSIFIINNSTIKKKSYLAFIFIMFAVLCHKSSIIYIPLLYLFSFRVIPKVYLYICLCLCWLLIPIGNTYSLLIDTFAMIFDGMSFSEVYLRRYSENSSLINKNLINMLPFNLLPAVFVYFSKRDSKNWKFTQIFVLGTCIYDLICMSYMSIRMTSLFYTIMLFAMPEVNRNKQKEYYGILFVLVAYFAWRGAISYSEIKEWHLNSLPYYHYKFFWQ